METANVFLYERVEEKVDGSVKYAKITYKDDSVETVYPFDFQPIEFIYDDEGLETVQKQGEPYKCIRYTPRCVGEAEIVYYSETESAKKLNVISTDNHGYINISERDRRYFEYSDGTAFIPIGINMAFPSAYETTDGSEFGRSGKFQYVGMRQYERWFRAASENGVNMVRIWIGHPYFTPDTEIAYEYDLTQFAKIDEIVNLARKYGIVLKLTLENFRHFDYERVADTNSYSDDVFRKFNKKLYVNGKRCNNADEWVKEDIYSDIWLHKVRELAKRYSGDISIFAVELWNEHNTLWCSYENTMIWNDKHLPIVTKMFPYNMVTDSLGSYESDEVKKIYDSFCWDKCAFKQVHRYLDQGAPYDVCKKNPLELLWDAIEVLKSDDKPIIVAETGAVNNSHSGPFKFYVNDDNGIIFADSVYTPFFAGSAGCGNIWHWDERYVEFKNLYKLYKPFSELVDGMDICKEEFTPSNLSDDKAYILTLNGKNTVLGYIRNKTADWQTLLRDLKDLEHIDTLKINIPGAKSVEIFDIWNDNTKADINNGEITFNNVDYGIMFRIKLVD